MTKKSFLSFLFSFMMLGWTSVSLSACSSDDIEESEITKPNEDDKGGYVFSANPEIVSKIGGYLSDISGETGIGDRDGIAGNYFIKTANGDRYYLFPVTEHGDLRKDVEKEFSVGDKIEFSGRVYRLNEKYVQDVPYLAELAKSIKLYALSAPYFTIKRIAE